MSFASFDLPRLNPSGVLAAMLREFSRGPRESSNAVARFIINDLDLALSFLGETSKPSFSHQTRFYLEARRTYSSVSRLKAKVVVSNGYEFEIHSKLGQLRDELRRIGYLFEEQVG
jgi:hypothetical protein